MVNIPPSSSETTVYIAKSVEKKKKLVLLPVEKKKVATSKRSNPGVPVPIEMRDPKRHYCDNCQCHYGKKEDLTKHIKYMCGKTVPDYMCEECGKGFHQENGVREHYYQAHLKRFLYNCTKCNKGFYFKSKKSNHKKACPNINDEEKYKGKVDLDPELEKTFQRRKLVELDTDKERSEDSEEEEEKDKTGEEKDKTGEEKDKTREEKDQTEEEKKDKETRAAIESISPKKTKDGEEETGKKD